MPHGSEPGLASLAAGVGAKAALGQVMAEAVVLAAGSVLVFFSAFCFGAAVWRELFPGPPPPRPDVRQLPALGCLLSINPDAHSIRELDLVRWGVAIARKGGLSRKNVLNTVALPALLELLRQKRPRPARPRARNKQMVPAVPFRGKKRNQVR
jgi:hypothetical protein